MADIFETLIMHVEAKAYHIYAARIFIPLIDCTSGWFITLAHAIAFAMRSITYPKTICLHMFRFPNKKKQNATKKRQTESIDTLGCTHATHQNIYMWQIFRYITWLITFYSISSHWTHSKFIDHINFIPYHSKIILPCITRHLGLRTVYWILS